MSGVIDLEEMEFYAYHGCFQEEKVVGNRFLVNVSIRTPVQQPVDSDNIKDALNYVEIYELVRREMQQTSNLLEHVGGRILNSLYEHFPFIEWARIKISKMNPPMGGQMKKVSLTLERER